MTRPATRPRSAPFGGAYGRAAVLIVALSTLGGRVHAASALEERLTGLLDAHKGRVAVAVEHLETGERVARNADEPMPTASLIKFPVMVEAYRQAEEGKVDLGAPVTLRDEDKVPGSGILTVHFSEGAQFSLRDAIRLMIAYSDNTATNLVLDAVGLPATAETMERMGFPETKIHSKVYRRDTSVFPDRSPRFGLGSTTAADMVALLEQLHARELVGPEASEAMLGHLLACEDRTMLRRYLPAGTKLYHKTGSVSDIRTSAGIIETPGGPVAVCVLTATEDQRWSEDNSAQRLIAAVSREVYNYFTSKAPAEPLGDAAGRPTLRSGSSGAEVEALQRALNARLDPSPGLAVDGEFGPQTESALVRFQRQAGLEATGIADAATRDALGPPPEADEEPEAPSPEEVRARPWRKQPAEALDGPPLVSATAWAIADAKTGEILWGDREADKLDMASTTKITTALVVLRMAEEDPSVLDEIVTFSEHADRTTGSTAGVRAGERLPVRELLYGLMLPSGNDASVALGEHFGSRLPADEGGGDALDPLARFVSAMNRLAEELELKSTRYENPHGLPASGHQSSAADLARLSRVALENPLFAEIVSTPRRGCTLVDGEGQSRNVVWTNTNRLLSIEGYEGVKTGTTRAAGSCLVSSGSYGDDRLIVVVLGADTSDGRYIDSRNLFRWAWRQRGHGDR